MRRNHGARCAEAVACVVLSVAAALTLGCEAPEVDVGQARLALGEPQDGFPHWQERVIFEWTNRARCDPAAALAGCTVCAEAACYSPVAPLVWNHNLARAARFHSANLVLNSAGLRHDSPCTLVSTIAADYVPGPCTGLASCACVGGALGCSPTCTGWSARVGMFGTPANGENIAYGSTNPDSIFTGWLWEPDSNPACGWRITNGHRANILGGSRALGVGRESNYFTQDFGASGTPSGVVSGVHYPQTGTSIQFWANWYASAAPASAVVNIDGTCHTLTRARGSDTNGAWSATVALTAGACHRYYFRFTDSGGTDFDYPTTGSFGINCADWEATRPATCGCTPACTGRECGPDGCGGSCGSCPTGETCNSSGVCVCTPSCTGRECGPDGCGGSCGSCPT
ncbi:MAG: hypothetical protein JXB32_19295, partial [Deltaproteobacteria bacterium]|nr:hypothetical protein [Deltaproteobacteria bacterium]